MNHDESSKYQRFKDLLAMGYSESAAALRAFGERIDVSKASLQKIMQKPVDMLLFCPKCGKQHIDEKSTLWDNPPHRSHLCHYCGYIWRPADVPTNGVAKLCTRGKNDQSACPVTLPRESIHIVFSDSPGWPGGSRFVEVENSRGEAINVGEWKQRLDGFYELVIKGEDK